MNPMTFLPVIVPSSFFVNLTSAVRDLFLEQKKILDQNSLFLWQLDLAFYNVGQYRLPLSSLLQFLFVFPLINHLLNKATSVFNIDFYPKLLLNKSHIEIKKKKIGKFLIRIVLFLFKIKH